MVLLGGGARRASIFDRIADVVFNEEQKEQNPVDAVAVRSALFGSIRLGLVVIQGIFVAACCMGSFFPRWQAGRIRFSEWLGTGIWAQGQGRPVRARPSAMILSILPRYYP